MQRPVAAMRTISLAPCTESPRLTVCLVVVCTSEKASPAVGGRGCVMYVCLVVVCTSEKASPAVGGRGCVIYVCLVVVCTSAKASPAVGGRGRVIYVCGHRKLWVCGRVCVFVCGGGRGGEPWEAVCVRIPYIRAPVLLLCL